MVIGKVDHATILLVSSYRFICSYKKSSKQMTTSTGTNRYRVTKTMIKGCMLRKKEIVLLCGRCTLWCNVKSQANFKWLELIKRRASF